MNLNKLFFTITALFFLAAPFFAQAQHFTPDQFENPADFYWQIGDADGDGEPDVLRGGDGEVAGTIALGERDPRLVIVSIINIVLGFLGIIAVLIILAAGLQLMLNGSNEDARSAAKKSLSSGAIGLIIIFAAFAVAKFIINALFGAMA